MINFPYLRQTMRSNLRLWIPFTLICCVFLVVMCGVFTPTNITTLSGMADGTFAGNLLSGGTLIAFMSNFYYAVMAIIFPMLYSIAVGNGLIAAKIDNGSMAGYLATPVSRTKIVCSSAVYLIGSLAAMWIVISLVGIGAAQLFQPDALDVPSFLIINLGAFFYHFAISSICFFASCVFDSSGTSLLVGGGIPLLFFVVNLLRKLSDSLDVLKYFTLNTLFDTAAILQGEGYGADFAVLAVIGILFYSAGILLFRKRDLPL